jgi:hypothetical protein
MQSAPAWSDLRSRCPVRELKNRDIDDRRDDEGADHRFFLRFRGFRLGGTPSNASTKIFVACVVAAAAWRLVCEIAWLRTVLAAVLNELSHMLMNGFFLSQGLVIVYLKPYCRFGRATTGSQTSRAPETGQAISFSLRIGRAAPSAAVSSPAFLATARNQANGEPSDTFCPDVANSVA